LGGASTREAREAWDDGRWGGGDSVEARATPRRVNRRAGRRGWMLGRAVMVDG